MGGDGLLVVVGQFDGDVQPGGGTAHGCLGERLGERLDERVAPSRMPGAHAAQECTLAGVAMTQ